MNLSQPQPAMPGIAGGEALSQAQTQFFIPATASLHERRPRTLKHGDSFAVFDHSGDAISGHGSPEGFYHRDTRHLSHLYLTINAMRPILLSSALRDDNAMLTCDLTNPDFFGDDGQVAVEHDLIHLRRSRFLWEDALYERLSIRNFDTETRQVSIDLSYAAGQLCLSVHDNAPGPAAAARAGGHGLANMRQRAEAVGGSVRIAAEATGFEVEARLPG